MAQETKYGIISDVHQDPGIVPVAIDLLKRLGAEKLLVNGDIGERRATLQDSQRYVGFILDSIGKSGLESFVQPGSHETLLSFGPALDHFAGKYSNIVDATKNSKVEQRGHSLVFLPGSDFSCGGEYQIGNHRQIPSGRYVRLEEGGLMQFEDFNQYVAALQCGLAQGAMQYANMGDLQKLVNDPDKTIMVCHVPRRFDDVETCVDMAEFGDIEKTFFADFVIYEDGDEQVVIYYEEGKSGMIQKPKSVKSIVRGQIFQEGSVFPIESAKRFVSYGAPVKIKRENRGNEDLKTLYEELGINKAVNGHFHESGHRANDRMGRHVPEGDLVTELFWNSGHLDVGQTGILTVGDGKVSYKNIRLEEHLN